tara:strand:+ start:478 stop:1578 length:1101 start_codon:yes stop_codon:yes gene_type:complete
MALSKAPLLILGGGLIGLSTAFRLASEGKRVEILSRCRNEAAGFVAAGMLAPHSEGLTGNLLKMGQISLKLMPEWVKKIEVKSGINCGLKLSGIVVPFENEEDLYNHPAQKLGKKLNKVELRSEINGISEHWNYGLLFNQDGQIDNRRRLMRALEKACVELGVHFQEGVEVLHILEENKKFKGIKIKNAEGNIKDIEGKEAVLCSGAWSNQLLSSVPVFPVKGQMLSIQGPKNALAKVLFGHGTYLVPRDDGLIVVGATSEINAGFREGLTPNGQSALKKGVDSLLPEANKWPHMERWWGFRPCTPDKKPIIGKCLIDGLWIATGHYRNGVLYAAITSELITKSILNEPLSDHEKKFIEAFRYERF